MVDGWFFGHFFWKVEGSSVHTCESHTHTFMSHVQLICSVEGGGFRRAEHRKTPKVRKT